MQILITLRFIVATSMSFIARYRSEHDKHLTWVDQHCSTGHCSSTASRYCGFIVGVNISEYAYHHVVIISMEQDLAKYCCCSCFSTCIND